MNHQSDREAKVRQAIYRGAKTETIVRELNASIALIKRQREAMGKLGITPMTDPLTAPQASYLLGLASAGKRVGAFLRDGRLQSTKPGRDRVITRKHFLEFAAQPRRVGNPNLMKKKKQEA
jgi:hypothetical protein